MTFGDIMDKDELEKQLGDFFKTYLDENGFLLVEMSLVRQGKDLLVRVLADRPCGGITLEECMRLNSRLGNILEEKCLIDSPYTIEVSSPGIDRPLKTRPDFLRCMGKEIRALLRERVDGRGEWEGALKEVKEKTIILESQKGGVEIPLDLIIKANQLL